MLELIVCLINRYKPDAQAGESHNPAFTRLRVLMLRYAASINGDCYCKKAESRSFGK